VGRERRTGEIDGNGGVLCGNVRGILVIVEGESGRELQFGSFTAWDVSLSANPGELTRELPSELVVWRSKLRSRS
jgi:hypothetical protein